MSLELTGDNAFFQINGLLDLAQGGKMEHDANGFSKLYFDDLNINGGALDVKGTDCVFFTYDTVGDVNIDDDATFSISSAAKLSNYHSIVNQGNFSVGSAGKLWMMDKTSDNQFINVFGGVATFGSSSVYAGNDGTATGTNDGNHLITNYGAINISIVTSGSVDIYAGIMNDNGALTVGTGSTPKVHGHVTTYSATTAIYGLEGSYIEQKNGSTVDVKAGDIVLEDSNYYTDGNNWLDGDDASGLDYGCLRLIDSDLIVGSGSNDGNSHFQMSGDAKLYLANSDVFVTVKFALVGGAYQSHDRFTCHAISITEGDTGSVAVGALNAPADPVFSVTVVFTTGPSDEPNIIVFAGTDTTTWANYDVSVSGTQGGGGGEG